MPRLTITLNEARHQALKEAAAKRRKSMGALIEESLELYGIKNREDAATLVAKARRRAGLSQEEAIELAVAETGAVRKP